MIPTLNSDRLFCEIGDVLEFIRAIEQDQFEAENAGIAVGDRYRATGFIGFGWDLERMSGYGPDHVRIINSEMNIYVMAI